MIARILLVAIVAIAALTGTASAAKKPADLVVKKVTEPPASVRAGGSFTIKAKIKNLGEVARGGLITMTLQDGPGEYSVPKRIGRVPVSKLDPDSFRTYRVRLTTPIDTGAGNYRLKTCLKSQGRQTCVLSQRLRITAR